MRIVAHTAQTREKALQMLDSGASMNKVYERLGIHHKTLVRWKRQREGIKQPKTKRLAEKKTEEGKSAQRAVLASLDASASVVRVLDNQARRLLAFIEQMTESAGEAITDCNHSLFKAIKDIRNIVESGKKKITVVDANGSESQRSVALDLSDYAEIGRLIKLYSAQLYENFTIPRGVIQPEKLLTAPAASNHLHLHAAGTNGLPLNVSAALPAPVVDVPVIEALGHLSTESGDASPEQVRLLTNLEE